MKRINFIVLFIVAIFIVMRTTADAQMPKQYKVQYACGRFQLEDDSLYNRLDGGGRPESWPIDTLAGVQYIELTNESFKEMIDSVTDIVKNSVYRDSVINYSEYYYVDLSRDKVYADVAITTGLMKDYLDEANYFTVYNDKIILFSSGDEGIPIEACGRPDNKATHDILSTAKECPQIIIWTSKYDKSTGNFKLDVLKYKLIDYMDYFMRFKGKIQFL